MQPFCMWMCALQAVCAHMHAHTYTLGRTRKQNQLVCATQTLHWSSWGSLGQSKTAILRRRRVPAESCNLSSKSLTWRMRQQGSPDLYSWPPKRGQCRVKCHTLPGDYVSHFLYTSPTFPFFFLHQYVDRLPSPPFSCVLACSCLFCLYLFGQLLCFSIHHSAVASSCFIFPSQSFLFPFFSSSKLIACEHGSYAWPRAAQPAW